MMVEREFAGIVGSRKPCCSSCAAGGPCAGRDSPKVQDELVLYPAKKSKTSLWRKVKVSSKKGKPREEVHLDDVRPYYVRDDRADIYGDDRVAYVSDARADIYRDDGAYIRMDPNVQYRDARPGAYQRRY